MGNNQGGSRRKMFIYDNHTKELNQEIVSGSATNFSSFYSELFPVIATKYNEITVVAGQKSAGVYEGKSHLYIFRALCEFSHSN